MRAFRMAIAALAVVATGACQSDTVVPPVAARSAMADSAEQVFWHLQTSLSQRGVLQADLQADTAYVFDDNSRMELRNVHTTFYTKTGQKNSVLTSQEGTYNSRQQVAEARKNVVVVTTDGKRLTTPQLKYYMSRDEISSDSAFVLTQPNGDRATGIGFVTDPNLKNIRILKRPGGVTTAPIPSSPQ